MGVAFGGHSGTESNATVATVVLDADGKIVFCRIDVAQNKYAFDEDEEDIVFTRLVSKMELGDGYGMAGKVDNNGDGIMLEWYLQTEAFEEYVIGKTVDEVAAMTTQLVNNHNISADDALLNAGCTIDIVDFKAAVVKACNDEQGVTFETDKDFTLGVAVNSENDGSSADDEENYTIKMNVEFAASVVIDGKVAATVNDAYQPNIVVADGEVVSATVGKGEENGLKTKRELKEAYGMDAAHVDKNGDGVSLEWYLQSAAYSEYVVGMTADEIAGLEAGDDLIEADCTIYIGGINAVVAESVRNAVGATEGDPIVPTPETYTLGMGVAFGGHSGTESNATVATVVLDADGKIVFCRIDVAQNKYAFDEDEEDIVFTRLVSKMELGDGYGMAGKVDNNGDGIMLEWYLQTEAFEEYVIGKTVDEVAAMTTQLVNNHNISADDALLNAGCTIDIVDFKAAVVKACNDEQGVTFETDKDFTLGVAVNSENDGSSADDEENYTIKMNVEFAASVVIDGKVAATVNDAYQPNIVVADGEVVKATVGTFNKAGVEDLGMMSKRELKELYNMVPASPIQTEWYVQSANYSEFVIGMTADEIAGLTLDSGLSEAGCTIYIGGINAVVAESVTNAR